MMYFSIIIFIFSTINLIITLKQTNFFSEHVRQKFSLWVLLSFCVIFCQFLPIANFIAYKKSVYKVLYKYYNFYLIYLIDPSFDVFYYIVAYSIYFLFDYFLVALTISAGFLARNISNIITAFIQ